MQAEVGPPIADLDLPTVTAGGIVSGGVVSGATLSNGGVLSNGGDKLTAIRPARRRRRDPLPYLLVAPAVLIILGFMTYPIYRTVLLSMQKLTLRELFSGGAPSFVGFANFESVLTDRLFWTVVVRTIVFTVVVVGLSVCGGLGIALAMRRVSPWVRITMTIAMVFVWAVPTIVATQIYKWMVDSDFGVVNYLIDKIPGVNFENHSWFASAWQGWIVIITLTLWGALPFLALTLYAGLTQVPTELVEAATIDGASSWQVLRSVLLPTLRPVLIIATTLSVIWDFQIFNQIFAIRDQKPENSYWTMGIYAYEKAFRESNYSAGATISVITLVLMLAVMAFYVRQMIKIGEAA